MALGAVVLAWAAIVAVSGGTSFVLGGVRISARSPLRAGVVGLVLIGIGLWRLGPDGRRAALRGIASGLDRAAPWTAAALAVLLTVVSTVFGLHVAGGADASGYVSQSRLWQEGRVATPAPRLSAAGWQERGWLVAPLGYRPARAEDELGPTYAPGLPWLMATGALVAGEAGRYVWTPLLAGLLVWGTFAFARRHAPPAVALSAPLLVASSPPLLFAAMQTMSDLPVAAVWLLALLAPLTSAAGAWGGGLAAGVALAVRPNLAPAAGAVWAAWAAASTGSRAQRARLAALRAVPLGAAALAIAAINTRLWGSPFISGYGAASDLYDRANVLPNLGWLWAWTVETRGYWTIAGAASLLWLAARPGGRAWWPALGLVVGVVGSYLPYAQFVEWWYLRFYLPAWPWLAAAASVAAWQLVGARAPSVGRVLVPLAAAAIAVGGVDQTRERRVFALWEWEQRYVTVAGIVRARSNAQAIAVAVQHSGALAYYTQRPVVRFDQLPPDALDAYVEGWRAAGRDVWLVVDDFEEPQFRARFAGQRRGGLDWAPVVEGWYGGSRVRAYDLANPTRAFAPELVHVAPPAPWPWLRRAGAPR